MNIINVRQGTKEWHEIRKSHLCASDAAAALGLSKYKSRKKLLQQFLTDEEEEISDFKKGLFERGHEAEAEARSIIEQEINDEFFTVTGELIINDLPLLASLDGLTMDGKKIFEHKLYNKKLIEYITENADIPDTHWPQLEQQLLVSGADEVLFVVSDGTKEMRLVFKYKSIPSRRTNLLHGWKTFCIDLERMKCHQ